MKDRLLFLWQHPFAPLLPWVGVTLGLLFMLFLIQNLGVAGAQASRERLEKEWTAARQALMYHREARKSKNDLSRVWAVLPAERDFTPLALGISDEAKRVRVTLPALTYKTEPTVIANTSKGLVEGQMTGRYEDLRRFIYGLETAEELLFIEDLELARPGGAQDALLTFNIKIATYLRDHTGESNLPRPAQ
ncbi:type 4a pilus biogenesis protein PilO [Nitrospira sp. BLG_2]|uniref:type 4a pilus biogenesis protein PilO n=1 Tax=Nitrospira sp. BLG_2 TaxID=3397507 RepID=UPI003B9A81DD